MDEEFLIHSTRKHIKITTSRKWEAGTELVNPVLVRVKRDYFHPNSWEQKQMNHKGCFCSQAINGNLTPDSRRNEFLQTTFSVFKPHFLENKWIPVKRELFERNMNWL